ncbi:2-hydroxyacid dehydrogenase [Edaphobacter sp. HDX4]|uniref:2-hydroxyacid dehydrogenase n=1 Tax=Edaphobacter sp. HDX4 TaxID=2794064 RepID=UPI002FE614B2
MSNNKLLLIGDHFISAELMRSKIDHLSSGYTIHEASTPFPLEPFRNIAEVREASGSEEQMIDALQGASICIAHHAPLTQHVLSHTPDLRLFIVCRGGPVNVNLNAATASGVIVGYTPGRNATATAEYSIAMLLAAIRSIPQTDAALRKGQWKGDYTWETAGFELESSTVGLVGYGAVGRLVAQALRAFGAKVLVYDPFVTSTDTEQVEQVSLLELLSRSDVVSLHARDTQGTRGMIGEKEIALMKKGSVLVNCARGSLLDYNALADALRSNHLFAAAADVFPEEPLSPVSELLSFPNFVATPHVAGGTRQAAEKAAGIAAEELERYLSGKPLRFCANPR